MLWNHKLWDTKDRLPHNTKVFKILGNFRLIHSKMLANYRNISLTEGTRCVRKMYSESSGKSM